jgi:hypothetical protein
MDLAEIIPLTFWAITFEPLNGFQKVDPFWKAERKAFQHK